MKLDIVERQLDHDHEGRTYGYRLTDLNGESQLRRGDGEVIDVAELVGHVRATLTVIPADEATSRVTYDVEAPEALVIRSLHIAGTVTFASIRFLAEALAVSI